MAISGSRVGWRTRVAAFSTVTLVLLVGGYAYYRIEADAIQQAQYGAVAAVGRLKADEIQQWRRERMRDAAVLAQDPFVVGALGELSGGAERPALLAQLHEYLKITAAANGDVDAAFIAPDGRVLVGGKGTAVSVDSVTRRAVAASLAARGPVLSDLFRGRDNAVYIDAVAVVQDAAGRPLGAAILRSDAHAYLDPLIQAWPTPSRSAETVLVERVGDDVIALSDLRYLPNTALRWRRPLSQTNYPAAQAVLGRVGQVEGLDYRGVKVLADLRPIAGSPWFMVAKVDAGELLAEARYRAVLIGLIVASLILLAAAVTASGYRRKQAGIYRELYELERGAQEALRASEVRYRSLFEHMLNGFAYCRMEYDAAGRPVDFVYLDVNAAFTRLTGLTGAAGKRVSELIPGIREVSPELFELYGRVASTGVPEVVEFDFKSNQQWLMLSVYSSEPGHFAAVFDDITERKRAEEALRLSLERFQLANQATFDVLWDFDVTANTLWRNDNFQVLFGDPPAEVEPGLESWTHRLHPDDRDRVREGLRSALDSTGASWSDTYRFRRRDGTYAVVEDRGRIARDAAGRAVRVIGAMQDVTEVRRAEERVRRLNRVYAVLSEINEGIVRIRDLQALYERACEIAVERGQFRMVWVGLVDPDTQTVRVAASAGVSDAYLSRLDIVLSDPGRAGGPTGTAFRTGRHDISNDIANDPRMAPWRDDALRLGYRASAAFPLTVNGATRGAFTLYATEPGFFDREELALLDDLAMNIGFAMELAAQAEQRRQLEAQFLQAQKMETVGRLAGGIAHDFNNLLTVINGTTSLAMDQVPPGDPLRRDLAEIQAAGERAANLTRQLLAFSRQQILKPDVVDLNGLVGGVHTMVQRLIGEDVNLVIIPGKELGSVRADPRQLEQVLLNLVVNARDAMPDGGTLTIETRNVELDAAHAELHASVRPGAHVLLSVSDTGVGMDEVTQQRIFEPFFTTKEAGKGTGLGLATVYGIVKQSEGSIWAYSEPGQGSTFKIYLPRVDQAPHARVSTRAAAKAQGTETILLVEDEVAVRRLAERILTSAGYTVLAAGDGVEALQLLAQRGTPVHLLLTDVVLPGISGRELAAQVESTHPEVRVLYTSGYTDDTILRHGVLDSVTHFLGKPYTVAELTQRVREVLDGPARLRKA